MEERIAVVQVVGLDIGGSKTHAYARDDGGAVREVVVGSANLASVGDTEAGRQLDLVAERLRDGGEVVVVCAGAAGVDTPGTEERLRRLLADRLPGATVRVVHDTELVLAAAGLDAGVALIAGTGSAAWARGAEGRTARAGGWGYLLGDDGGGYAVSRDAVRHALGRVDRHEPVDPLSAALVAACGLADPLQLIDHFYAHPERRGWAAHAHLVFTLAAADDPAAREVVADAGRALAALVRSVRTTLGPGSGRLPLVLAGGLLVHQPLLAAAVRSELGDAAGDVVVLAADPAYGAYRLAAQLAAAPSGPCTPSPVLRPADPEESRA